MTIDRWLDEIESRMAEISAVRVDPLMLGHTSGVDPRYAMRALIGAAIYRVRRANPYRYIGRVYDPRHPLMRERSGLPSVPFSR